MKGLKLFLTITNVIAWIIILWLFVFNKPEPCPDPPPPPEVKPPGPETMIMNREDIMTVYRLAWWHSATWKENTAANFKDDSTRFTMMFFD